MRVEFLLLISLLVATGFPQGPRQKLRLGEDYLAKVFCIQETFKENLRRHNVNLRYMVDHENVSGPYVDGLMFTQQAFQRTISDRICELTSKFVLTKNSLPGDEQWKVNDLKPLFEELFNFQFNYLHRMNLAQNLPAVLKNKCEFHVVI